MSTRRLFLLVASVVLVSPCVVRACGFIESGLNVTTFRKYVADNKLVLCAQVMNSRETPEGGSTKLAITSVIKDHPSLVDQKGFTIPRYIPIQDPKDAPRYLIFADTVRGQIEVDRGAPLTDTLLDYVKGLMKLDGKDRVKVLRYCADYLEDKNREIADDAFAEFMQSPDTDIGEVGKQMSAKTLRGWIEDEKMSSKRLRMYGFLLGNCGGGEDARALRAHLERRTKEERPGDLDGILSGYTLLKPKEGWAYVRTLMKDPEASFQVRYACLRAARFFHNTRPDVIAEKDILVVSRQC